MSNLQSVRSQWSGQDNKGQRAEDASPEPKLHVTETETEKQRSRYRDRDREAEKLRQRQRSRCHVLGEWRGVKDQHYVGVCGQITCVRSLWYYFSFDLTRDGTCFVLFYPILRLLQHSRFHQFCQSLRIFVSGWFNWTVYLHYLTGLWTYSIK